MNNRIHFDHTLKLRLHPDEVEFRISSASRSVFYYYVDPTMEFVLRENFNTQSHSLQENYR